MLQHLTILLLAISYSLGIDQMVCPFQSDSSIAGWSVGQKGNQVCYSVHGRQSLGVDASDTFCQVAYQEKNIRRLTDRSNLSTSVTKDKKVLLTVDSQWCLIYSHGKLTRLLRPCGDITYWDSIVCEHFPLETCEIAGNCVYDFETDNCTYKFNGFKWAKVYKIDKLCKTPTGCWCRECTKTTWSDWMMDVISKETVRRRPKDSAPETDCVAHSNICCSQPLQHCENGGTLNEKNFQCVCSSRFSGLRCELLVYTEIYILIIIFSSTFLCVVVVFVVVRKARQRKLLASRMQNASSKPGNTESKLSPTKRNPSSKTPRKNTSPNSKKNVQSSSDYIVPKLN